MIVVSEETRIHLRVYIPSEIITLRTSTRYIGVKNHKVRPDCEVVSMVADFRVPV